MYQSIAACRLCNHTSLDPVLSLGHTPLADALVEPGQLPLPELRFPLEVVFCRNYPYYSSFSDALLQHSRENAEQLVRSRRLNASSLVVELASNDGYMLKNFAGS